MIRWACNELDHARRPAGDERLVELVKRMELCDQYTVKFFTEQLDRLHIAPPVSAVPEIQRIPGNPMLRRNEWKTPEASQADSKNLEDLAATPPLRVQEGGTYYECDSVERNHAEPQAQGHVS